MKLFKELLEATTEKLPGTYAGVRFSPATKTAIENLIEELGVPNPTNSQKFHTTLLYSRDNLPNYKALGKLSTPLTGTATEVVIWETQPDEDGNTKNCLVVKYDCDDLTERHHKLLKEHNASYDFEYQPHITLSYDIGDWDKLDEAQALVDSLPTIEIVEEYQMDLDTNWADKSTKDNNK